MSDFTSFKKAFGPEAKNYTKYRESYPKELFELLVSLLPKESASILDLGCGTGKSTESLVGTGLAITGADHDSQMIEEAKEQARLKKLDIEYTVAAAESLPFPDNSFDVITIGTAFHFFVNETAMLEISRVLKSKGLVFVYWTLVTKDIPQEDDIPGEIFHKYGWVRIPSELRDLEYISTYFKNAGLLKVGTTRIPIVIKSTVEERVGLQTTSGFYELLSEEDKVSFLNEVREVLIKQLGDRPYFTLEEEIQVCYGFKD